MAMFMMGPAEILLLMLLTLGGRSADLVSLLDPRDYFKHKGIDLAIPKMIELAGQEPKTGADQIAQLLALRILTEDAAKLKSADQYAAHRQLLEQIAEGTRAQDKQGFAKEFARRTLLAVDGKTPTPAKPAAKWREEALSWFPANASLVFAADTRASAGPGTAPDVSASMAKLMQIIPPQAKKEIYGFVEKLGNIHIERLAFALVEDKENPRKGQVMLRATGKADKNRIIQALTALGLGEPQKVEGFDDQAVLVLRGGAIQELSLMFVGETDVFLTATPGPGSEKDDNDLLVKSILQVRAKKKASVLDGDLKADLKRVPAKASAFLVGQVPSDLRRGGPPMPRSVFAFLERTPRAFDLQLEGSFDNAEQRKAFVQTVFQGRTQAIEALKMPGNFPMPGLDLASIQRMFESLQVAGDGDTATLRMLVPDQAVLAAPTMWFGVRAGGVAPPPKEVEKK